MTIVYEIGEIARFQNAREFSSYCRLVPGVAQSGPISRRGRHAKQGSPHLKWAFGQAALYAVRYYPKIRRAFDRHLARHRGKGGKLIAYEIIAHKLALAVYHVLRDGTVYREELLFRPYPSEGGRHPGRLTGRIPTPLIGSGLLRSFRLWICPDRYLDPNWRGLVPSRRPVSETGTEPMIFWCLSRMRGTAWCTQALGTHAEPV
jgi:Transposase IS116/IS110/IS902 family